MRFLAAAAEEMAFAAEWYESKSNGLGHRFLQAIEDSVALLDEFPRLGVAWSHPNLPEGTVRRFALRTFPFLVIYRVGPEPCVVAIAHGHQEPGYWIRRLNEHPVDD